MKDRAILGSLAILGLLAAFWFMVLSPKRDQASELSATVTELESSLSEQEQVIAFAEQSRRNFPKYYGRLVVLGKAVPEQADTASLLVQLSKVSADADVEFLGIELGQTGAAPAPVPEQSVAEQASSPSVTDPPGEEGESTTEAEVSSTAPAPATEAAAASLPIGATVGPAGLPILPYNLTFSGRFFDVSKFIAGLDDLVEMRSNGTVAADGRLLTIDGFSLSADEERGLPFLTASFAVTTYATPSTEGLTLGASPTAPAPGAEATPASAVVSP